MFNLSWPYNVCTTSNPDSEYYNVKYSGIISRVLLCNVCVRYSNVLTQETIACSPAVCTCSWHTVE